MSLSKQKSNLQKAKSGNWSANRKFLVAYYDLLVKTSQAVIETGSGVPPSILSAAHKELKSGAAEERLILKSKGISELNRTPNTPLVDSMSAWTPVFEYIGAQCGSTGGVTSVVKGTSAG